MEEWRRLAKQYKKINRNKTSQEEDIKTNHSLGTLLVVQKTISIDVLKLNIEKLLDLSKDTGTRNNLSLDQKKDGLNHTIKIIRTAIEPLDDSPIKDIALNLLRTLQTKINSISIDGRPRQLEELIKRIDNANAGYIMQDEKTGKIFYPVIADMFIFELNTIEYIIKNEPIILPLAKNIYSIKRKVEVLNELNNDKLKKAICYQAECSTDKRKKHYLASLFSKELKIEYKHIKKLIEHLFYQVANNAKLPNKPMNHLPEPFIEPLRYSFKIAS